ncbi:MAG: AAA family ATPase [bacterium]|nr:AAA family ATPase [bacterium]
MIRIAFTGPESSGKTTLAKAASTALEGEYIEEFSRSYLEQNGPDYAVDDLDIMAKGHADAIENASGSLQLVDTDFVVFKVWSEYRFDAASPLIHRLVSENWFDLHVLCAPDIPWEADDLRENPDDRDALFLRYVEVLEKLRKPYLIVEGSHKKRLKKVTKAIEQLRRIS